MHHCLWALARRPKARSESARVSLTAALALAAAIAAAAPGAADPLAADTEPPIESADEAAPATSADESALPPTAALARAEILQLSLADALALGIENNLTVELARHEPLIADANLDVAWSAYDPILSGDAGYRDDRQPLSNAFAAGKTQVTDGGLGADWQLPMLGASVGIRYDASKTEAAAAFVNANPQWDSGLTFNASVPLLRNLIWNQEWVSVRTSRIRVGQSELTFEKSLMDTVAGIEDAYWNLVASREQLNVARKSLESTEALRSQVETQYEVGVVSKVDVVESEAGVADREFNLITAENAYERAQDVLIDAVLGTKLHAGTDLAIDTTDAPEDFTRYEVDVEIAVAKAFERRPDYKNQEATLESEKLALKHKRNQMLPQLELQGSYSTTGRGGIGTPIRDTFDIDMDNDRNEIIGVNPTTATGINDTNSDLFGRRGGDIYTARGVVSIPLGNLRARKEATIAEINLRKANTRLIQLRQEIIKDVRDTARTLRSSLEGIDAAERRRVAAAEQLRAERVRLEHGESTPFDVLQRERDLVEAESQKIAALRTYRASETNLLRAQGTLLESRNIVLESAAPLRPAYDR